MKSLQFALGISSIALALSLSPSAALAQEAPANEQEGEQEAENDRGTLGTIIVSARRIDEDVLDAPLSIGVLDSDFLATQRVESIEEVLTLSPGATFLSFAKAQPEKSLRGFVAPTPGNASSEQSIVTVVDGFVLTKDSIKSPPVFDLERVEVLRGPQGTTFGRNASVGLIHLVTRRPTFDFEAGGAFTIGSDELFEVNGYISGPLSETLAARVAVNFDTEDGATQSISTGEGLNGQENFAIRGSLLWEPSPTFSAYAKLEYSQDRDEAPVRRSPDCTIPTIDGPRVTDFEFTGLFVNHPPFATTFFDSCDVFETEISDDRDFFVDRDIYTATAELQWEIADGIAITSITGYQDGEGESLADVLGTAENIVFQNVINDATVFSEEIRIDNHGSGNDLRWLAGFYYLHDEEDRFEENQFFQTDLDTGLDPLPFPRVPSALATISSNTTDSYAVFGEVIYDISDSLELAVGGRWSRDEKDYTFSVSAFGFRPVIAGVTGCTPAVGIVCGDINNPVGFAPVNPSESFSDFSGKASLTYRLNEDHSVYFLFSQGFKSGGFQPDARTPEAALVPFDSEHTNNFELGWKGEIDNRLRMSLTAFHMESDGIQTVSLIPIGDGFQGVIDNVGSVRSIGLEGDFTFLISDNFRIGGSFTAIDSELQDTILTVGVDGNGDPILDDLSGERPEVSPRWTATFYSEFDVEFSNGSLLTVRGDFNGRDNILDDNVERGLGTRVRPTLTNFGARISYEFGSTNQYRILGWMKNINEDVDFDNIGPRQPNTLQLPVGFTNKRSYGITLSADF